MTMPFNVIICFNHLKPSCRRHSTIPTDNVAGVVPNLNIYNEHPLPYYFMFWWTFQVCFKWYWGHSDNYSHHRDPKDSWKFFLCAWGSYNWVIGKGLLITISKTLASNWGDCKHSSVWTTRGNNVEGRLGWLIPPLDLWAVLEHTGTVIYHCFLFMLTMLSLCLISLSPFFASFPHFFPLNLSFLAS